MSSEGENYDIDDVSGSESDGYAPAPKTKAAVRACLATIASGC
jgi:DNA topoisomerase-2